MTKDFSNSVYHGGKSIFSVRQLVAQGMLAAIGVVLVTLVEIPIFPTAAYLKYDPADIPILIGSLLFGPVSGVLLTIVVSFLQSFAIHGSSGVVGFIMHVTATSAMAFAVGLLSRKNPTGIRLGAVLACGCVIMTVVMVGMNLLVTPIFFGLTREKVAETLVPVVIPFNLLKSGINSLVAFGIYRAMGGFLRKISE
ncbi:ECF transporter S component [Oscillospiraceae bacterium MB08-C2-2]|nr:ECF transporter S component [Oscillospiraceae bacterium MB08-C2-2]